MNQDDFQDSDQSSDHWTSSFEDECYRELDTQVRGVEPRLKTAEELAAQHLWLGFQHTSTAIAQLYNSKSTDDDGYLVMVPFNKAAESLTKLYKDSLSSARECLRVGLQSGKISRSKDIAAWARKKRKCIRRDELLAFLCGKTIPSHTHHHHHRNRQGRPTDRQVSRYSPHPTESTECVDYPLRDNNLGLQGLSGAMSNINVSYNRHSPTTSCSIGPLNRPTVEDLMIHDEFGRSSSENRKRNNSSSTMDVSMDSPSRKRGKFM